MVLTQLFAEMFRQREVADFFDDFLAFVAADPSEVGGDLTFVQSRIHIYKEIAPNGVDAFDDIFFGGINGGRIISLLDCEMLRASTVGGTAVTDPVFVFGYGLEDRCGARHGLGAGRKVFSLQDGIF